ncbi:unnamed protein product [Rotaria sp. Silwood1]|nr:unnamed protein product [Rotaria sp. Silwood1]CAF0933576.1 unnamed protein product [Rotaria sp. Silwood1]CAF3342700.1 unnamed protein product [Rotaria sp. Silwood1]CAF3365934.1 unnamed protein product [Rotaria sp. Silwood1]
MSLTIRLYKRRKFIILFLILIILIGSFVIFQSINNYLDSIKQSNLYLQRQASKFNSSFFQRAILIFYPSNQESHYLPEIRWLYRSWIEMMKYESKNWRTDLIIYTGEYSSSFQQLGCILNQRRLNNTEPPQCRVFLYLRLSKREISSLTQQQTILTNQGKKELFDIDSQRSILLYKQIKSYEYIDSVNIIAESYPTYKYYDFILKTDVDVFITTQFAKYVPLTNITLLVGRGGYSTKFNTRRLGRIARDMNWKYQNMTNVGSTWYGTPYVAQRMATLTLDAMLYLSENEFTRVERERKLGVLLWPEWHYGVLSMYGTHLAVNHLLISEKLDIKKADELLDQSTTDTNQDNLEKNHRLHLHCWHTDKQFSKFAFKAGKYNHIHPRTLINDTSAQAYAMRMALESRLMTLDELGQHLHLIGSNKTK